MFRNFFATLPRRFVRVFAPRYLAWHALAIVLTYLLVTTGFDWYYFVHTRTPLLLALMLPAAILGFFVPVILPVGMYYFGEWRKKRYLMRAAVAVAQAGAGAYLLTILYKTFTGRTEPDFLVQAHFTDISHGFHLGFLQNGGFLEYGLFYGWPSSHTAVAWAGTAALIYMYPKNKVLAAVAALYAIYIGIGISVTIHWFSEFVAGAIFGTLVGVVVAKQVSKKLQP